MDFPEFDHVDSEKAEALLRCRKAWKHGSLIRIAKVGCALLFLGYILTDVELAGGFLCHTFRVLTTPFSVFVFGNSIVLIVFVLSGGGRDRRQGADGDNNRNAALFRFVCEEYESLGESTPSECREETMAATVVEVDVNKKLHAEPFTTMESDSQGPKDEFGLPGGNTDDDTDDPFVPFRWSKSEEITTGRPSWTELRRWATHNWRSVTMPIEGNGRDGSSLWPLVDDLSDVEFNLKVEMYITRKKLLLREEVMAERTSQLPNNHD